MWFKINVGRRNPSGSEIRSVAVQMSNRLEQCKEVVEVMTRKVVEFLETNMGMVEDNLGRLVTILHILYYIPAGSNNGNK